MDTGIQRQRGHQHMRHVGLGGLGQVKILNLIEQEASAYRFGPYDGFRGELTLLGVPDGKDQNTSVVG